MKIHLIKGWTKTETEWMEFLADNLLESNDASQECFVPVRYYLVKFTKNHEFCVYCL